MLYVFWGGRAEASILDILGSLCWEVFSIKKQPGWLSGCGKVSMRDESNKKQKKRPYERKNEQSAAQQQEDRHKKNTKRPKQTFVIGQGWIR